MEHSSDSTVLTSNREKRQRHQPLHLDFGTEEAVECSTCCKNSHLAITFSGVWQSYRALVRKHRINLELADEAISRLLFWIPHHEHSGNNGPPWREVLYGLLSLNRLSMHCSQVDVVENSYGTSLRMDSNPTIPATSIRVSLSVLHCLMPSLLEIFSSDPSNRTRRQTQLRLRLEQVKFALRLCLLVSYWKQSLQTKNCTQPGILLDGGLYHADQPPGLSVQEVHSLERRQHYAGRRTGIKIAKSMGKGSQPQSPKRLILGELLSILRPLYWASAESQHHYAVDIDGETNSLALLKAWIGTFSMDAASLGLLCSQRDNGNNGSRDEWNRRRMQLFLYLLRSPIWSRATSPTLERTSSIVQKVPLIGRLVDVWLWDWILYWKHPYVSEEG